MQSLGILATISTALADSAIAGFKVREGRVNQALDRNPILVTALNPVIGYELGAATAKQAYKEGRPILEVALETTSKSAFRGERSVSRIGSPAVALRVSWRLSLSAIRVRSTLAVTAACAAPAQIASTTTRNLPTLFILILTASALVFACAHARLVKEFTTQQARGVVGDASQPLLVGHFSFDVLGVATGDLVFARFPV